MLGISIQFDVFSVFRSASMNSKVDSTNCEVNVGVRHNFYVYKMLYDALIDNFMS